MSTKIYNAYKVKSNVYINDLISLFRVIKQKYKEECVFRIKEYKSSFSGKKIMEKIKEDSNSDFNEIFNFKASVVVYFHDENYYCHFFGLNPEKLLVNFDNFFEDFHYQNQTDRPKDISEGKWLHRKEVWDDILEKSHYPSEVGLSFDFFYTRDRYELCRRAGVDIYE